ncbi:MAG: hypothetical protein ACXWD4_11795, partial [Bacteroidia bacterium]
EIITNEANAPRLGRLLVGAPQMRGKGLGQQFISELIDECVKLFQQKRFSCSFSKRIFPLLNATKNLVSALQTILISG